MHFEFLVEEPSMEAFLRELLPRLLRTDNTFEVHPFQGKTDLLSKLTMRLRAYASWLPEDWRILVIVDRDDDDCMLLKQRLDESAVASNMRTRTNCGQRPWQLVNRIAIEELEAWYFGDWQAVRLAYPRVSETIPQQARYRNSDGIQGGTWEAFERVLQRYGYFETGLRKLEVARVIGAHLDVERNRSQSFRAFYSAIADALD